MSMRQQSTQQGATLVKMLTAIGALMVCGLTAAGFSVYQLAVLNQEHDTFKSTIESEIQTISTLHIPDTKTALTQHICAMLDDLGAQYEPHYVRIDIEKEQQRMSVQVWYQRPLYDWLPQGRKMFYASIEKMGFDEVIETSPQIAAATGNAPESPQIGKAEPTALPGPVETASLPLYTSPLTGTDANFQQLVLESPGPVIVYFWAEWCGYCRKMSPSVDAAAHEFSGQVTVVKIDIDRNRRVSSKYEVRGIPLLLLFRDGKAVGTRRGFMGERVLFAFIREYLY